MSDGSSWFSTPLTVGPPVSLGPASDPISAGGQSSEAREESHQSDVPSVPVAAGALSAANVFGQGPLGPGLERLPELALPASVGAEDRAEVFNIGSDHGRGDQNVARSLESLVRLSDNMVAMMQQMQNVMVEFMQQTMQQRQQQQQPQQNPLNEPQPSTSLRSRIPPPPPRESDQSNFKSLDSKLIPSMPMPDVSKWSNRPSEILGFAHWIESLTSWLSTLQPAFGPEINEILSRTDFGSDFREDLPGFCSVAQQERSTRLFFILKQALGATARCASFIKVFESRTGIGKALGYTLLRALHREFSVTTRGEGLHFRTQLLAFRAKGSITLKELVFQVESELYSYERILNTCTDRNLMSELRIGGPDQYRWLILNLEKFPHCLSYVSLHCDETFESAKQGILAYYQRTVLNSQEFKPMSSTLSAFSDNPSLQTEKKGVTCFKFGKQGHYAKHCRSSSPAPSNNSQSKGKSTSSSHAKEGSSKGLGKGKKGKNQQQEKGKGKGKGKPKGFRAAEYGESIDEQAAEYAESAEQAEIDATENPNVEEWSDVGDHAEETEIRLSAFVVDAVGVVGEMDFLDTDSEIGFPEYVPRTCCPEVQSPVEHEPYSGNSGDREAKVQIEGLFAGEPMHVNEAFEHVHVDSQPVGINHAKEAACRWPVRKVIPLSRAWMNRNDFESDDQSFGQVGNRGSRFRILEDDVEAVSLTPLVVGAPRVAEPEVKVMATFLVEETGTSACASASVSQSRKTRLPGHNRTMPRVAPRSVKVAPVQVPEVRSQKEGDFGESSCAFEIGEVERELHDVTRLKPKSCLATVVEKPLLYDLSLKEALELVDTAYEADVTSLSPGLRSLFESFPPYVDTPVTSSAFINPFCLSSNVEDLDLGFWFLLDSGASRSVISDKYLPLYDVVKTRTLEEPLKFSTASGEKVSINTEVVVKVTIELYDQDRMVQTPVHLRALVSRVQHNLLSIFQVSRQGWEFTMSKGACSLKIGKLKLFPIIWSSCPWIKIVDTREDERKAKSSSSGRHRSSSPASSQRDSDAASMDVDSLYERRAGSLTKKHTSFR